MTYDIGLSYDPLGKILTELRDDPAIAAVVSGRVYGAELPAGLPADPRPYILIQHLGYWRKRTPTLSGRLAIHAVALTPQDAAALDGLIANVLHRRGPRGSIYQTMLEIGGQPATDPDKRWPSEMAIYTISAATQAAA